MVAGRSFCLSAMLVKQQLDRGSVWRRVAVTSRRCTANYVSAPGGCLGVTSIVIWGGISLPWSTCVILVVFIFRAGGPVTLLKVGGPNLVQYLRNP